MAADPRYPAISEGLKLASGRPVFAVLKAVAVVQEIVGSGGYLGLGGRRVSTVDIFDVYFLVNRLRAIVRHLVRGREGYPRGARPRLTGGVTIM